VSLVGSPRVAGVVGVLAMVGAPVSSSAAEGAAVGAGGRSSVWEVGVVVGIWLNVRGATGGAGGGAYVAVGRVRLVGEWVGAAVAEWVGGSEGSGDGAKEGEDEGETDDERVGTGAVGATDGAEDGPTVVGGSVGAPDVGERVGDMDGLSVAGTVRHIRPGTRTRLLRGYLFKNTRRNAPTRPRGETGRGVCCSGSHDGHLHAWKLSTKRGCRDTWWKAHFLSAC
jgi:hypothetical protein